MNGYFYKYNMLGILHKEDLNETEVEEETQEAYRQDNKHPESNQNWNAGYRQALWITSMK